MNKVTINARDLRSSIDELPPSRERSVAMTHLDSAKHMSEANNVDHAHDSNGFLAVLSEYGEAYFDTHAMVARELYLARAWFLKAPRFVNVERTSNDG